MFEENWVDGWQDVYCVPSCTSKIVDINILLIESITLYHVTSEMNFLSVMCKDV